MDDALNQISFREMQPEDIAAGLALCRASRWNQLQQDWELFLALSPAGCSVAVKGQRVVGTMTTVSYQDKFSWIGMVLVDPAERRQGIGTLLLQAAIHILSQQRMIRLDATPAGREVYVKLGFVEECLLSRMETVVADSVTGGQNNPARQMVEADLQAVCELDREAFGADRRVLLEWLFAGAPEYARVIRRDDQVAGYILGRHGFNFEHLGPVVAQDREVAEHLVSAVLAEHAGKTFILDATRQDESWLWWLAARGFREQRPFIRMFRGENLAPGQADQNFAILGPEFG